jgi:peptidyl-prolyl cis-trans isomerase A (cyclophilin A)
MNRHSSCFALVVALGLIAAGCNKQAEEPTRQAPAAAMSAPTPQPSKAEPAPAPAPTPSAAPVDPALLKPEAAKLTAPAKFKVKFTTTKGDFVVEVTRAWAPMGADRFYNLAKLGFFTDVGFFRVVPDFVVQFGIHGNPQVAAAWKAAMLQDDKMGKQSNEKGTLTYAKAGPNTRTTQLFINFKDNPRLDQMGFPPFGKVIQGMNVVEAINKEYGEQPDQGMIQADGNNYLRGSFPRLDYVKSAEVVK